MALSSLTAKSLVAGPPPQWAMLGTMNSRANVWAFPPMCLFIWRYQRAIDAPEKIPSLTDEEMISLPPLFLNGRRSSETPVMKSIELCG